jgi:flagellar hook-associated protein 3 FlgL
MNRVSTAGNYAVSLANLQTTQQRQVELGRQVSSQKVAQDLKGYANKAETLTSMRSVQTRIAGLLEQNKVLADRHQTQDVALNQVADSALGVREAIAGAMASSRVDTLMEEIAGHFADALQGLNTKSQGRYLFSGGQINTAPVDASSLADLASPVDVMTLFKNDRFVARNQVDETSTIDGGMLADDIAGELFKTFQEIQDFATANPFSGDMTEDQRNFLKDKLGEFDTLHNDLVNVVARNGSIQNRIDSATADLKNRADTLEDMIGGVSNVDMPEAISKLQLAQFSVQAAAEVFNTLRDSSLLNFLR